VERIDFNGDLKTGIAAVDEQHAVLIDIYNELISAMEENHGNRVMNEILARLFRYAKEHFSAEEELLLEHHYDELQRHQDKHTDLVKSIRRYVFRHTRGGERITQEMVNFIGTWITEHIMVEDMKYVDCLNETAKKEGSPRPEDPVPS
jgi:hemerythrin